jgi:hypothetical protein
LFLDALQTLFPIEADPTKILAQLQCLQCEYDTKRHAFKVRYLINGKLHTFKYAAALFAITSQILWDHTIQVHSTGSWMQELEVVAERYGKSQFFAFNKTQDIELLFRQEMNANSWGLKQALSLLPRARYLKGVTCRMVQGRLSAALKELGYKVQPVANSSYPYLDT